LYDLLPRVAVLLDKQARRGAVLPLDLVEQVIDGAMKAKLENWLSDLPSPAEPARIVWARLVTTRKARQMGNVG